MHCWYWRCWCYLSVDSDGCSLTLMCCMLLWHLAYERKTRVKTLISSLLVSDHRHHTVSYRQQETVMLTTDEPGLYAFCLYMRTSTAAKYSTKVPHTLGCSGLVVSASDCSEDPGLNLTAYTCVYRDGYCSLGHGLHIFTAGPRSTQPYQGSLNWVPVSSGVKAVDGR